MSVSDMRNINEKLNCLQKTVEKIQSQVDIIESKVASNASFTQRVETDINTKIQQISQELQQRWENENKNLVASIRAEVISISQFMKAELLESMKSEEMEE